MDNLNFETSATPEAEQENQSQENSAAIPNPDKTEPLVSVKFNKEIRKLSLSEAGEFAQKGLKFDSIAQDYETLKKLARENGHSVPEFLIALSSEQGERRKKSLLEQCGGNEELAEYVIQLEVPGEQLGLDELAKEFPHIKELSDIPESVLETAKLKGTLLLDEYLRYCHENEKIARTERLKQKNANAVSIGSQNDRGSGLNPETTEFLNGLWK